MDRLKNKVALITGGARGLGASIASYFFNEGANVILCDVNIIAINKPEIPAPIIAIFFICYFLGI